LLPKKIILAVFLLTLPALAQQTPTPPPSSGSTVIFSRSLDSDASAQTKGPDAQTKPAAQIEVTVAERNALNVVAYDLDVHLVPASTDQSIAVRAKITVRNDTEKPVLHLSLQISSTLKWEGIELEHKPLAFQQGVLDSDVDHTGKVQEAVVTLPQPLAANATLELEVLYSGQIAQDGTRLERIGAPEEVAHASDWDRISAEFTGLRGFGNVLWYPVASQPLFLGDGAKLFQAVGTQKMRDTATQMGLHLTVEYSGAVPAPREAIFCGSDAALVAAEQESKSPESGLSSSNFANPVSDDVPHVATAEFPVRPVGFRIPSLFVMSSLRVSSKDEGIVAYTDNAASFTRYKSAASDVLLLLTEWLGMQPAQPLVLVDLPEIKDQPFEDGRFLFLPMDTPPASALPISLAHAMAHRWMSSAQAQPPWIDEGLAEFMTLLEMESTQGRQAALDAMQQNTPALVLAEPESPDKDSGQSLVQAQDEIYYQAKAADVWWMLRDLVGNAALQKSLQQYRAQGGQQKDPALFQHLLEAASTQDLQWFFDDWVYHDRGLPDLSIIAVVPRQLQEKEGVYLVSVEVANDGYAAAEVPVTLRAGAVSITQRLRVPARQHVTTRILFTGRPDQVQVNDGSVPEQRSSIHKQDIPPQP